MQKAGHGIPDSYIYSVEHFLATTAQPPLALHGDARGDDSYAWQVRLRIRLAPLSTAPNAIAHFTDRGSEYCGKPEWHE
jgi:hypothetical protein